MLQTALQTALQTGTANWHCKLALQTALQTALQAALQAALQTALQTAREAGEQNWASSWANKLLRNTKLQMQSDTPRRISKGLRFACRGDTYDLFMSEKVSCTCLVIGVSCLEQIAAHFRAILCVGLSLSATKPGSTWRLTLWILSIRSELRNMCQGRYVIPGGS